MAEPLACPILSLMQAKPLPCLGSACAWWTKRVSASSEPGCALPVLALFFQERRFNPSN